MEQEIRTPYKMPEEAPRDDSAWWNQVLVALQAISHQLDRIEKGQT